VQSRLANRTGGPAADARLHGSFCGTKANCDRGVKVHPLGGSRRPLEKLCKNLQILLINLLKHEVHLHII
jgi:hypothetical protein